MQEHVHRYYCRHCNEKIRQLVDSWVKVVPNGSYGNTAECPNSSDGHEPRSTGR